SIGASHSLGRHLTVIQTPHKRKAGGAISRTRPAPQRRWHARTKHTRRRQHIKHFRDKSVADGKTRILVCDPLRRPIFLRNLGKTPVRVTEIGFGGAPLGNLFAVVAEQDAQASLAAAWDNGCRFFDTAPFYGYGLSERRFGDALREKLRAEFRLSTKVGRLIRPGTTGKGPGTDFRSPMPFYAAFDYSYDATMRSFED